MGLGRQMRKADLSEIWISPRSDFFSIPLTLPEEMLGGSRTRQNLLHRTVLCYGHVHGVDEQCVY